MQYKVIISNKWIMYTFEFMLDEQTWEGNENFYFTNVWNNSNKKPVSRKTDFKIT